jgi:hypothetical protein
MNWKTILAIAVLVAPVAYCTAVESEQRIKSSNEIELECIKAGGNMSWTGMCVIQQPASN